MALVTGTKLGPYEILGVLGAGGMGEVYRARDTKLNRDVALKVLPERLAADSDRLARFHREAQVLASLNHPNIAHLYGLEDASSTHALVMELVEGGTLGDRMAHGSIPLLEALPIAKQIVDALEAAHEQGIVHRDLKPANIKVRGDGTVKVLDFGLARALDAGRAGGSAANSPTITSPALTEFGVVLGTAAYMSPEQAAGKVVDKRTDLWGFGVVLTEMLTGGRLFDGPDAAHTIAAVLKSEPDWTRLPAGTPVAVRRLLRRCLEKDRRRRIADASDVRLELEEVGARADRDGTLVSGPTSALVPAWQRAVPWTVAAAGIVAAIVLLALWSPWRATPTAEPRTLLVSVGADVSLESTVGASAILSPDGKTLAFVATAAGAKKRTLFVRRLVDQLEATPLPGTDDAETPFFSPSGERIGFFANGKLRTVSVLGVATTTVCDVKAGRGGAWLDDDTIVFSPDNQYGNTQLMRVQAKGGTPTVWGTLGDGVISQRWPQALPGGRGVLFTETSRGANDIVFASPSGGDRKVVVRGGTFGRYVPTGRTSPNRGERDSGHLIYVAQNALFVVSFDLERLESTGNPVRALDGTTFPSAGGGVQMDFSPDGTLVYVPIQTTRENPIDWIMPDGKTSVLRALAVEWGNPRFSPDGRKLALRLSNGTRSDIWVYEWSPAEHLTQVTFNEGRNQSPVWIDNGHIAFSSDRAKAGTMNLYYANADGTGGVARLSDNPHNQHATSSYGKLLAYTTHDGELDQFRVLTLEGDAAQGWTPGADNLFFSSAASMSNAEFSPDGKWIAYVSTESGEVGHGVGGGKYEVFVRPFPGPGSAVQVSVEGGKFPRWLPHTNRLFFLTAAQEKVMVAEFTVVGNAFRPDKPVAWSPTTLVANGPGYDIDPGGQRIAAVVAPAAAAASDKVVFVLNFFDHLRAIAPIRR